MLAYLTIALFFMAFCMIANRLPMMVIAALLHGMTSPPRAKWPARRLQQGRMQQGGESAEKLPVEASAEAQQRQLDRMQERDA